MANHIQLLPGIIAQCGSIAAMPTRTLSASTYHKLHLFLGRESVKASFYNSKMDNFAGRRVFSIAYHISSCINIAHFVKQPFEKHLPSIYRSCRVNFATCPFEAHLYTYMNHVLWVCFKVYMMIIIIIILWKLCVYIMVLCIRTESLSKKGKQKAVIVELALGGVYLYTYTISIFHVHWKLFTAWNLLLLATYNYTRKHQ